MPEIKSTLSLVGPRGPKGDPGLGGAAATASALGAVQLAGGLGGAAAAPTVLGFADRAAFDAYLASAIAQAIEDAGGVTPSPTNGYVNPGYVNAGYVN